MVDILEEYNKIVRVEIKPYKSEAINVNDRETLKWWYDPFGRCITIRHEKRGPIYMNMSAMSMFSVVSACTVLTQTIPYNEFLEMYNKDPNRTILKYYKKNIKDKAECQYKGLIRNLKRAGYVETSIYIKT